MSWLNKSLNPLLILRLRPRLEEELDIKIYPGTEIMRDVGSHNFIKSSANGDAVLVPQPSPSPHDPLVNLDPPARTGALEIWLIYYDRTGIAGGNWVSSR